MDLESGDVVGGSREEPTRRGWESPSGGGHRRPVENGNDYAAAARPGDGANGRKKGGVMGSLKRMLTGKGKDLSQISPTPVGGSFHGHSHGRVEPAPLRTIMVTETDASEQSTPKQNPSTPPREGHAAGGIGQVGSLAARDWDERVAKKREKERALLETSSGASTLEVLQMAKYLGMDPGDKSAYWIAEEALNASLPPGWVEHKTDEDAVYYYNKDTKESSWEHPTDVYYRFMYKKLRKMRKQRKLAGTIVPNSAAQRSRDRHLVSCSSSPFCLYPTPFLVLIWLVGIFLVYVSACDRVLINAGGHVVGAETRKESGRFAGARDRWVGAARRHGR